ncbi:MAG: 2-isopropylmalate synthase [Dehalococcoidia bacterium]|nr:2-isopropylmalate synthase [Dehalococcoidia bacterium]MQF99414.1 2-isopropylmalate synthase [SAR202 cluster bacterium]|tara:strand:+ start:1194 stop:2741 length:1548 start_codon:yes stop_codon:yes gene_type:complete
MPSDKVVIFDTTLRDGEQAAGAAMTLEEKIEIAKQLERLNVDVIEAGFAASSPGDFEAVKTIAEQVRKPIIASLSHANIEAVDKAAEALRNASKPRIHVFLSSSDIHLMHQLRKNREEVMEMAIAAVSRAKSYYDDIEFSPMDATRTDASYLYVLLEAAIEAGATTINIPDTVGYAMPEEFANLLIGIQKNIPNWGNTTLSVHCHNDLGLSVANSLAAVKVGARQVEGCINGLGERAGNASIEEVIMGLKTRGDFFGIHIGVDTTQLYRTSRLVSDITGFSVQANKAVVGQNAFRHASGIHQDGVLKDSSTYEIMDPRSVGIPSNSLVLGKLSGRAGLRSRLEELGYKLEAEDLNRVFEGFKELADKKREVTDKDLEALMSDNRRSEDDLYKLEHVQVSCGDHEIPTATVRLVSPEGDILTDAATGTGPVDAVYLAINRILKVPSTLKEFSIGAITEGTDALGDVTIRIEKNSKIYTGRGSHTDIIVASAKAYINALNKLMAIEGIPEVELASTK